jgi:uncharacterized cupin superfamily protein
MFLSAEKIAVMTGVRRVHNLNPAAIRTDKSLGDEAGLKNMGIHLISIAPGDKSTEFMRTNTRTRRFTFCRVTARK